MAGFANPTPIPTFPLRGKVKSGKTKRGIFQHYVRKILIYSPLQFEGSRNYLPSALWEGQPNIFTLPFKGMAA